MANVKELEGYLDNPNVQAYLAMIRDAEGTSKTADPYRTRFGGKVDASLDLNKYPTFQYKEFTQTDGKKNKSGAVGAYQFITKTWAGLADQYGFKDFSPRTQDLGAIALLKQSGALQHIVNGDFNKAVQKSNKTWASLPGSPYAQKTRSEQYVMNSLQTHLGNVQAPRPQEEIVDNTPKSHQQQKSLWQRLTSSLKMLFSRKPQS